jgi:hypothetical protein
MRTKVTPSNGDDAPEAPRATARHWTADHFGNR